jgi:hypothetical protein
MVYLARSDGALCIWEGMSEADILTMLTAQGLTGTILSETDYLAALAALQPQP